MKIKSNPKIEAFKLDRLIFLLGYTIYNCFLMVLIVLGWIKFGLLICESSIPLPEIIVKNRIWVAIGVALALVNMIMPIKILKIKLKKYPNSKTTSENVAENLSDQ